jgi:ribosomal protein L24E
MKCSYCSSEIRKGTGIMFVSRIGDVSYFCSGRCYKFGIVMRRSVRRHEKEGKEAKAKPKAH